MSQLDRAQVLEELRQAPASFQALLDAITPDLERACTNGTRWTNREMLFHLWFGYTITWSLLPLVKVISRLPRPFGRAFAAVLNAGTPPFHLVNYVGSVIGGRVLTTHRMGLVFIKTCAALERRLLRESDAALERGMAFPTRWDPFFTENMTVLAVYHYALEHFEFHRRQLTF